MSVSAKSFQNQKLSSDALNEHAICGAIANGKDFHTFASAFRDATGLGLVLMPADENGWDGADYSDWETELCRVLHRNSEATAPCGKCCRGLVARAVKHGRLQAGKCSAGITSLALPILQDGRPVAVLLSGKIIHQRRLENRRAVMELLGKRQQRELRRALRAFHAVPCIPAARFRAACTLLRFFARTLELRLPKSLLPGIVDMASPIQRAKLFIRNQAAGPITLREAATHAGLSVQHFCEVFKRETDSTFSEYLARERIDRSAIMLQQSRLRIIEIAHACGFQSLSAFNRTFKRLRGITPSQHRRTRPNQAML